MVVNYKDKKTIEKEALEKSYQLTCSNPRCFVTYQIKGPDYDRILREEGNRGLKCPKCGTQLV